MTSSDNFNPTDWEFTHFDSPGYETEGFDGFPCPTQKLQEVVGDDGIEFFIKEVEEVKRCKKKIFGKRASDALFHPHQQFDKVDPDNTNLVHLGESVLFFPIDEITSPVMKHVKFVHPERFKPGNYVLFYSGKVSNVIDRMLDEELLKYPTPSYEDEEECEQ